MLNNVSLIGRLTKKPELKDVNGKSVVNFVIAVQQDFTNKDGERGADFIQIQAWDKQAENIEKFLDKGSLVSVEGSIRTRSYENAEKQTVYVTEVSANKVGFLESKPKEETEESIKAEWTKAWELSDKKPETKEKLRSKYQPRIDMITKGETDLPF